MDFNTNRICRLCLKNCRNDFKLLDEIVESNLNSIFLYVNLTVTDGPLICKSCEETIKHCLNCKTQWGKNRISGMDIENSRHDTKIKFKIGLSGANFCRFCLNAVELDSCVSLENSDMEMLLYFPELDFDGIPQPTMCILCYKSLRHNFDFIRSCLQTEDTIIEYCNVEGIDNKGQIDLDDLVNFKSKKVVKNSDISNIVTAEQTSVDDSVNSDTNCEPKAEAIDIKQEEDIKIEDEVETKIESVEDDSTQQSSQESQNIIIETGHHQDQLNTRHTINVIRNNNKKERQKRYREQNREKLKQREAERRKRIQCLQSIAGPPTSSNTTRIELNNEEIIAAISQSSSSLEITRTSSIQRNEQADELSALQKKRERQQRYREQNRDKLKQREAERRRRLQSAEMITELLSTQKTNRMKKCDLCSYTTTRKYCLDQHILSKHKSLSEVVAYGCQQCTFKTKYKSYLRDHMMIHKSADELVMYKCEFCVYQSMRISNLNRHVKTHYSATGVKTYKCPECAFETTYKKSFKTHVKDHRSNPKKHIFKCAECAFETDLKKKLRGHVLTHEDPSKVAMQKCTECTFETKHIRNLRRHMLIHKSVSEVVIFSCIKCNFQSKHSSSLRNHMVIYHGESEGVIRKCPDCDFQTKHKGSLWNHMVRHNPSMCRCSECRYEALYTDNLQRHLEIQESVPEVPKYVCYVCGFETMRKFNLKRHVLKHGRSGETRDQV